MQLIMVDEEVGQKIDRLKELAVSKRLSMNEILAIRSGRSERLLPADDPELALLMGDGHLRVVYSVEEHSPEVWCDHISVAWSYQGQPPMPIVLAVLAAFGIGQAGEPVMASWLNELDEAINLMVQRTEGFAA